MFIGHFAVGLAAKKFAPKVSLGMTFLACQFLDLIWPLFVMLGVESVKVEPGATLFTPLAFHYPYSHSLLMAIIWSALLGVVFLKTKGTRTFYIIAAVVFSHWLLDYISHGPDLPVLLSGPMVGLGLWNYPLATVILELAMFGIGLYWYVSSTRRETMKSKLLFWSLIGFMLVIYAGNSLAETPPLDTPAMAIAGPALAMWLFVVWGYFADKASLK